MVDSILIPQDLVKIMTIEVKNNTKALKTLLEQKLEIKIADSAMEFVEIKVTDTSEVLRNFLIDLQNEVKTLKSRITQLETEA